MYPSPPLPGLVNVAEIYGNTAEMTTLHRVCLVGNTPGDAQWTSSGGVGQIEGTHRVLLEDSETKACAGSHRAPLCGTVSAGVSFIFISIAENDNGASCWGWADSKGYSLRPTELPLQPLSQGPSWLWGERRLCQSCP